jgi:3-oxosteroid 1-dehydrogenase
MSAARGRRWSAGCSRDAWTAGVVPQTSCRGVRLLIDDGEVTGVVVDGPDGTFEARARGGVVLATGGFEHDPHLVRTFLRGPLERAVSVPTNTGDALRMAMRAGADLATMREAWWVATIGREPS